jgi:hypothetical protein
MTMGIIMHVERTIYTAHYGRGDWKKGFMHFDSAPFKKMQVLETGN